MAKHEASLGNRFRELSRGSVNMDDLIQNLRREADRLDEARRNGVTLEGRREGDSQEYFLVANNREIAEKYGISQPA